MNRQQIRKSQIIFGAAAALLLLFALLCGTVLRRTFQPVIQNHTGHFDTSNGAYSSLLLAGEWEYYPGLLICSEPSEQLPTAETVQVPDFWFTGTKSRIPSSGNASYRMTIDGLHMYGNGNLLLSLYGFLQNYKIYINGEEAHLRLPAPYGYQLYPLDLEGEAEIVIELEGSSTGLTICPELTYIGVHMSDIDTVRNLLFISITLFLILFLMFLVFSFSPEAHGLRPRVILGFFLTLLFVVNTLWGTGYLDQINTVFSNSFLQMMQLVLQGLAVCWIFFIFHRQFPQVLFGARYASLMALPVLVILLRVIAVEAFHWNAGWILVYLGVLAALIGWVLNVLQGFSREGKGFLEVSLLYLSVLVTMLLSLSYSWDPNRKYLQLAIPAAMVYLIIVLFVDYYRYQHAALRRTQELLELEKYASRSQTALLSSQIQPHFLYNTLLTIQELCRFDPPEASRVIVRFSEYLRHNMDFMNYAELIPFEKEERHIDNFIYIQEARFQDKLRYTQDIEVRDFMIPPLTVQPVIENAVKYGVRGRIDGGYVFLHVFQDTAGIHIVVRNSGPGFDVTKMRTDHSVGNIRTRLKALLNASLTISSAEGQEGTTVEILIPAQQVVRAATVERNPEDATNLPDRETKKT